MRLSSALDALSIIISIVFLHTKADSHAEYLLLYSSRRLSSPKNILKTELQI